MFCDYDWSPIFGHETMALNTSLPLLTEARISRLFKLLAPDLHDLVPHQLSPAPRGIPSNRFPNLLPAHFPTQVCLYMWQYEKLLPIRGPNGFITWPAAAHSFCIMFYRVGIVQIYHDMDIVIDAVFEKVLRLLYTHCWHIWIELYRIPKLFTWICNWIESPLDSLMTSNSCVWLCTRWGFGSGWCYRGRISSGWTGVWLVVSYTSWGDVESSSYCLVCKHEGGYLLGWSLCKGASRRPGWGTGVYETGDLPYHFA